MKPTPRPPGRNQPCPCGSGRKYKHCCLDKDIPRPDSFETRLQAGIGLLRSGDSLQAAVSLAAALDLQPRSVPAIGNLGVALLGLGDLTRAIPCFRQAIALDPTFAAAHSNLGYSLAELGHTQEALQSLETAIALDPTLADALVNLGGALHILARFDEAADASRRALQLRPGDIDAQINLGNALKEQGLLAEAATTYRRAVECAPTDPRGHINLGETLRDQGDIPAAVHAYEDALAVDPRNAVAFSNLLYLHAFTRDIPPTEELALARTWEQVMLTPAERETARHAASIGAGIFTTVPPDDREDRRLRVGIVSAELGAHAVAEFLEPILQHLDRDRFHLTLFPVSGRHCERAARIRALADGFVSLTGVADSLAVDRIREQHIDVLLDTSGHTAGNRLGIFARRAAPVQATYVGYWSTTGLTEMDYFLADPDPPAAIEAHFSERFWRLPRLGVCYRGDPTLSIDWQPDPESPLWLGSFNKFAKIREETIALWSTALHALPQAKLLLEDRGVHEDESHHRIRTGFAGHGIDPARIHFIPFAPGHERHMLLYNRLDIALDTVPFNSGTTGFDALWMGVPMVSVEGQTLGARIAGAALNALGRPGWVAPDAGAFASTVRNLATALPADAHTRNELRRHQRAEMMASPLGEVTSLVRGFESALTGMYNRWLQPGA